MTFVANQRPAAPWSYNNWWGRYDLAAELPNILNSPTQLYGDLQVGDLAWAADTGALFVCTDPSAGNATWQVITTGTPPAGNIVGPSNAIYVDIAGNDGTGTRGDASKPFLTPAAAFAALQTGDEIVLGPGSFAVPATLVAPAGVQTWNLRGVGPATTLTGGANINVIDLTGADASLLRAVISDLRIVSAGTGKCLVGNGVAYTNNFLQLGLYLDNVRLQPAAATTLALDLAYACFAKFVDCEIRGSISSVICGTMTFIDATSLSPATALVTWNEADAQRPTFAHVFDLISSDIGITSLTGQPFLRADATSSVASLTGLNLVVAGGAFPRASFDGTVLGTTDFSTSAAKQLPDTASSTWDFSNGQYLGAVSFALVAGAAARQAISFDAAGSGSASASVTAGYNVDLYSRNNVFVDATYVQTGGGQIVNDVGRVVTESGATRTVTMNDNGKTIYCTDGGGCTITVTDASPDALAQGFSCIVVRSAAAGVVTIAAAGGVSILADSAISAPYTLANAGQSAGITMVSPTIANLYGSIS